MEPNASTWAILGLIARKPRSGYDVKRTIDATIRHFWAASYGQIYPELKRLSEAGLVKGIDASTGGRKRSVYEITADGEDELKAWLRRPPETTEMREEGLLKLFFAGVLPPEQAIETLRAMRAMRESVAAKLRGFEPDALEKDDPFPLMVLRGGIEFNEWFADWCERMERRLLDSALEKRSS
jgi:DNA-binding PadR family transcriptional regulator